MYMAPIRPAAVNSYRTVDLASRVEGASAHRLVALLFEEALKALDALVVAIRRGDYTQRVTRQGKALSILNGLEATLDHEKGGEIARDLATIYGEARRLTMAGSRANDPEPVGKAGAMLREIASAWEQIA